MAPRRRSSGGARRGGRSASSARRGGGYGRGRSSGGGGRSRGGGGGGLFAALAGMKGGGGMGGGGGGFGAGGPFTGLSASPSGNFIPPSLSTHPQFIPPGLSLGDVLQADPGGIPFGPGGLADILNMQKPGGMQAGPPQVTAPMLQQQQPLFSPTIGSFGRAPAPTPYTGTGGGYLRGPSGPGTLAGSNYLTGGAGTGGGGYVAPRPEPGGRPSIRPGGGGARRGGGGRNNPPQGSFGRGPEQGSNVYIAPPTAPGYFTGSTGPVQVAGQGGQQQKPKDYLQYQTGKLK